MHSVEWNDVINIAVGWALTFVLGFEREVRGAPAGDRTFSMIGLSTALIGAIAPHYPAVLGGAVTGIGFIGGGLCFRQAVNTADQEQRQILHGVTTAASIFGAAAIGAIAGCGDLVLAGAATIGILLSLEIRHIPVLRYMDARRWAYRFNDDNHAHFKLHDLEHALTHPHQEFDAVRAAMHAHNHAHAATIPGQSAGSTQAGSPAKAGGSAQADTAAAAQGEAHDGVSLVGPIEDDSLVKQAETASILANAAVDAGVARGGR